VGDKIWINDSIGVLDTKGEREMVKRVGNSTEPTMAQMQAVTENLHKCLGGQLGIRIEVMSYLKGPRFELYFETPPKEVSLHFNSFNTWTELLTCYRKIMTGAKGK
jgi:hypothetical protein